MTKSKLLAILNSTGAYSPELYDILSKEFGLNLAPLEERKEEFKNTLREYVEEYGRDTVFDFFKYWSDHGERGKKMRFEKEKTFNISLRLKKWQENSRKFSIVGMLKKK